ncbi:putative ribonuclease H-like domain-containing protein [Tanacetum coccineum]
MNYVPVVAGNQTNGIAGSRDNIVVCKAKKKTEPEQEYILIPICTTDPLISQDPKVNEEDAEEKPTEMDESEASNKDGKDEQVTRNEFESTAGPSCNDDDPSSLVNTAEASNTFEEHLFEQFSPFKNAFTLPPVLNMTPMNDTGIFGNAYDDEDVGADADLNNLETTMNVSPIPTTRINKDHLIELIIGDLHLTPQTRRITQEGDSSSRRSKLGRSNARGASTISTSEDERGIVVRNKARVVTQGYTQAECVDYDEVFALVSRIEAIRLFLAYASFMGFIVYQMDVKSAFLYGTIKKEFETLSTYLIENGFRRGTIDETLFIKKDKGDILLVQVYVDDIIFGSTKKSLCDEFEGLMHKRFQMSSIGELTFFLGLQVQQKSMIGSLMYLTASRPDIMFAVCACARFTIDLERFFRLGNMPGASLSRIDERTCNIKHKCVMSQTPRQIKRGQDTKIPQSSGPPKKVGDEAVHKELGSRIERAATTASSLKAEQSEGSTIPVEPHLTHTSAPSTSHPSTSTPSMQTTHDTEEPATMPHDLSHPRVQSLGSDEGSLTLNELTVLCTTLSKKVEDLQSDLKQTKLTYGAAYTKLIMRVKKLEHKGRRIAKIDQNPFISLVQDEGTSWIQEDAEIQGRTSNDTEILLDQEEPTELVKDLGSGEKGEKEISTAGVSTAKAELSTVRAELSIVIPKVSTTAKNLKNIRRSAEKRKDKGKAIMKEDESVQKKTKKQLEQEILRHEEAIRLQE